MVRPAVIEVDNSFPVLDNLLGNKLDVHREAVSTGSLPASATAPATSNLVKASCGSRALVATESEDEGCYVVRLEGLNHLFGHDGGGHGSASIRGDGVDEDVVLVTLKGQCARETKNTTFLYKLACAGL